jgi:8-oxo-dGTP diphosphatase
MNKHRIAALLKRFPWVGVFAQYVWRLLFQPWVTAGVVGVILNESGQMLMVEHVFHPQFPWGLPGGWMARREDPEETIRREALEETGLHITVVRPLIVMRSRFVGRHLDMAYMCYAPAEVSQIRLSEELLSYRWINPEEALQTMPLIYFHRNAIQAALADREFHGRPETTVAVSGDPKQIPPPMTE